MAKLFRIPIERNEHWEAGGVFFCMDKDLRRQFHRLPADLAKADLVAFTHPGPNRFRCTVEDLWGDDRLVKADDVRRCCVGIGPHNFYQSAIMRVLKRHSLKPGYRFYVQVEYD